MKIGLMVGGVCVLMSSVAMAQDANLPWLSQGSATAQAPTTAPASAPIQQNALPWSGGGKHAKSKPVDTTPAGMKQPAIPQQPYASTVVEAPETQELDDRKLNAIAADYYAVSAKSSTASSRYAALLKQATAFRKALESRQYDAHDLVADAKKLEGRIAAAKKKADADAAAKKAAAAVTK